MVLNRWQRAWAFAAVLWSIPTAWNFSNEAGLNFLALWVVSWSIPMGGLYVALAWAAKTEVHR